MHSSHFSFFESLLGPNTYENMKKEFIGDYLENVGNPFDMDFERGIIYDNPETSYHFSTHFEMLVNNRAFELKNTIIKNMYRIHYDEKNANKYLQSELEYIQSLSNKFNKDHFAGFDFDNVFYPIAEYIKMRLGYDNDITDSFPTFKWNTTLENAEEKLSKLFTELSGKEIIEGTKQDFLNGFKGKEVKHGIKWIRTGRNPKHTSKPTLFYFIDYLINREFIEHIEGKEYYGAIIFVFRDLNGEKFTRNRNTTSRGNTTLTEDLFIKQIIDDL